MVGGDGFVQLETPSGVSTRDGAFEFMFVRYRFTSGLHRRRIRRRRRDDHRHRRRIRRRRRRRDDHHRHRGDPGLR